MDEPDSWAEIIAARGADAMASNADEDVDYLQFVYDHLVGAVAAKLGFCAKT